MNKIYDYKYIQIFHFNEQNKWENISQKQREIREYKNKEGSDSLGPCT